MLLRDGQMNREGMHALVEPNTHRVVEWIDADAEMPSNCAGWYRRENPQPRSEDDWADGYSTRRAANPDARSRKNPENQSMLDETTKTASDATGEFMSIVAKPATILTANAVSAKVVDGTAQMVERRMPESRYAGPMVRVGLPFLAGSVMAYASDDDLMQSAAIGVGITGVSEAIEIGFEMAGVEKPGTADEQMKNGSSGNGADGSGSGSDDMGAAYAAEQNGDDMGAGYVTEGDRRRQLSSATGVNGPDAQHDPVRAGAM